MFSVWCVLEFELNGWGDDVYGMMWIGAYPERSPDMNLPGGRIAKGEGKGVTSQGHHCDVTS